MIPPVVYFHHLDFHRIDSKKRYTKEVERTIKILDMPFFRKPSNILLLNRGPLWIIVICICMLALSFSSLVRPSAAFENRLGIRFVYIYPNSFMMGSPVTEKGRDYDEKQHRVTIKKGFHMSVTEVTQGQWMKLMGYNPSAFPDCGSTCPVENVSWEDCQAFIKKLNQYENTDTYRLPTEAEWEYACRAGSQAAFENGDITETQCEIDPYLDQMAWYCGNSGLKHPISDLKPHPVGLKQPNAWGLYDMHGNVQEWCLDACEWRDRWTGKVGVITDTYRDGVIDPLSKSGSRRVFRGGSWNAAAKYCRSAGRSCFKPNARRNNIGFRIVRTR